MLRNVIKCVKTKSAEGVRKVEGSYMKEDEKTGIVRQIVNLLAEKKCTAQEAEEILRGAILSVGFSAIVQKID